MSRGWRAEAKRYGAPAAFLLAVTIGVLVVRSGLETRSTPTTTVPTTVSTQTGPVPKRQRRFYHLRAGETLSDVALRFNTTVDALLVLNPHVDPNALEVGQRIRVR
ncbi:MAG: LysM peptidoglycan-binding domain-containing protein [Actinobacteria bacterium]|nr:MAG: LysM peptidoglycan-binding domain-containing protein [Actinomycetota bacterium]